jgi:hypothetical protein
MNEQENEEEQYCKHCESTGYNKDTQAIEKEWYSLDNENYIELPNGMRYNDNAHCYHITQVELDALWKNNRLWDFKNKPTVEEANEWSKIGMGHDAINRWICIEALAKEKGVWGTCEFCNSEQDIFDKNNEMEYRISEEGGALIKKLDGGGYMLYEIPLYGGVPSYYGSFETLQECKDIANKWT